MINIYHVRDGIPGDYNLVMASFLRNLYYSNPFFRKIPKKIFMDNYKKVVPALISRGVVKVACLNEDPNHILGFSLLSADYLTIHYVFVKKLYRKTGIGRSLVPSHPSYVSHLTTLGEELLPKLPGAVFNPFSL